MNILYKNSVLNLVNIPNYRFNNSLLIVTKNEIRERSNRKLPK